MQEKNAIRLRFLGAIGTVTGSCTLMEYYCAAEDKKQYFLIDIGVFQNEGQGQENKRTNVLRYYAKKIEAIFITHAHLDHIGLLPEIIQYGFRGKVYCTRATHDLILTMLTHTDDKEINKNLLDKINFYEVDSSRGEKGVSEFGDMHIRISNDLILSCLRTSHVLGSCAFYFQWTEKVYSKDESVINEKKEWKYLHFSGDIGPVSKNVMANVIFKDHQTPYWDEKDICIIMESTYGGTNREGKENNYNEKIKILEEIIDSAILTGGSVIIPAFALDRAQQILTDLYIIYQKKKKEISLLSENNYSWKEIIKNLYNNKKCNKLPNIVSTLQGKKERDFRKQIIDEIDAICIDNNCSAESFFNEINDECQNRIIEIFEQYIPKPSINKIQEEINSKYRFTIKSPLIGKINEIYINHLTDEVYSHKKEKRKFEYISDKFLEYLDIWEKEDIDKQKESIKKILSRFLKKNPNEEKDSERIIVTASGMCDEGKVITFLGKYLRDEKAVLILTGFMAKDTNGYLLKMLLDENNDEKSPKEAIKIELPNDELFLSEVKCKIVDMSKYYSGHADQEQLLDYVNPFYKNIKGSQGKVTVLLNHGTEESRNELKTKIEERNEKTKVILPDINKWIDIVSYEISEPDNDMEFIEEKATFNFVKVGDIHIYYPMEYDNKKIQSIIDYISGL